MRLAFIWITTLLFASGVSGQITFVNPPADTSLTCRTFDAFPPDPETTSDCEGNVFMFFSDFSDRVLETDTCAFYEYTVTRIFTATNNCADTTQYIQIISIIDTISPIFTPPPAVSINCDDLNNLEVVGGVPNFADECGGPITATYEDDNTKPRCGNTITRTWTVSDVCGNFSTGIQEITIEDTTPPFFVQSPRDISVMCSMIENPYPIFNDWVKNLGYATYQDGCNEVNFFFSAVPGSYDINDASTFPGEHPNGLNPPECGVIEGASQFETVDFVIVDDCGNTFVEEATFFYVDDAFPVLGDCGPDITVDLEGSECISRVSFDIPSAIDSCNMENLEVRISDVQNVSSNLPGDPDSVVMDINFRLEGYGPEFTFEDDVFFEVNFTNIDADGDGEFFTIYDENGIVLDTTPSTIEECGSLSFQLGPFDQDTVLSWAEDGVILFHFEANIDTAALSNSINDVCSFGMIEIAQTLTIENAVEPVQKFFQLDDEAEIPVDGITIVTDIDAGAHIVKFIARDCAGNSTACVQNVVIFDDTAPQLNCAPNMMLQSTEENCAVPVFVSDMATINNPCDEDLTIEVTIDGAMDTVFTGLYAEVQDSILHYPQGVSSISVRVTDFSANQSQCVFSVEVEDNIFPVAICDNIDAPAVAVQLESFQVSPFQLAGNSTDNCGIRNIVIENNQFSCFDLGQVITRTVLVIDESNNISTCNGTFNISAAPVPVSYTAGICPDDSLLLFLNIPQRSEYVYDWDGPLGFSSVLAEPFVPQVQTVHEGLYTVTITNTLTGCESFGSIDVLIDDVNRPMLTTEEIGCTAIPHRLTSTPIAGAVTYNWYQYIDNARSLIATSEVPFLDFEFEPGDYIVGLTVSNDECESNGSNRIEIEIRGQPDGAICNTLIEGCIGSPLELCANDQGDDFLVRWFGPNGFESSEIEPFVTDSFTSEFSGVYKLVFENNLCITDTFTTTVTSNITPPTPSILGDLRYCAGEEIEIASSEIENGYIYVWESPSGTIRNNQPVLRIPDAGSQFTGDWTLSIEDGPCLSPASELANIDIEATLDFEINPVATQCEGVQITLSTNATPESVYEWTGPNDFVSNSFAPLVDVEEGFYQVSVTTINGCNYADEIYINTVVIPDIVGVTVSNEEQCIDPENTLTILPIFSMSADVQFEWIGPNITSQSSSLNIENYSFADNGIYQVKILNGDCESETFDFILDFTVSPIKPTIDAETVACLGDPMTIKTNLYNASAIYQWNTPAGMIETTVNELVFDVVDASIAGSYSVQVMIGECMSSESDVFDIVVNNNEMIPSISTGGDECVENEYILYTDFSGQLGVEWELPDGSFVIADTLNLLLSENEAGDYRARTYEDGCPSEWSAIENIDVLDPRNGISLTTDFIFSCNNDDSGLEFCVETDGPTTGVIFQWFLGDLKLGETSSLCYEVEEPELFAFGSNEISLKFNYNGCIIPFEDPLFLEIENVRDIDLYAGDGQLFCVGDALIMNADEVNTSELSAFWSVDSGVQVDDITDPMAEIVVMEDLDSTYAVWNVEHIECGVVYRDSVVLKQKVKPLPMIDSLIMDEIQITFSPLENDTLIDGNTYQITEVSDPRWGSASISGNEITFRSDPKFIGGPISFTYTVCDDACSGLCNEGEVLILYNLRSCKGNNVLTPNNDGANDLFIIPCIEEENLPDNKLVILNELGNTIFEQSPYDNSWDGTFNGQTLPEGTYYYIFRKDNQASVVQGFISIER